MVNWLTDKTLSTNKTRKNSSCSRSFSRAWHRLHLSSLEFSLAHFIICVFIDWPKQSQFPKLKLTLHCELLSTVAFVSCIHPHRRSTLLLSRSLCGRNTCEETNCDGQRSAEIENKIWWETTKEACQKDEDSPKFNEQKGFEANVTVWSNLATVFFLSLAYVNGLNLMAVCDPIRAKKRSRAALTYALHHSFDCSEVNQTLLRTNVLMEGEKMEIWFTTNLPSSRIPPKISKFVNEPRINFVQRQLLIRGI